MIQLMIQVQSAPESRVCSVPPTVVLFQRRAVGEKFSGRECSSVGSVPPVLSSGCRIEFRKRCVSGVRGVGCVPVQRPVASAFLYLSRSRAFVPASPVPAFGPSSDGPKSVLQGTLQKSRRAAAASKFGRMWQRLAAKTKTSEWRSLRACCGVSPEVASVGGVAPGWVALVPVASSSRAFVASLH